VLVVSLFVSSIYTNPYFEKKLRDLYVAQLCFFSVFIVFLPQIHHQILLNWIFQKNIPKYDEQFINLHK